VTRQPSPAALALQCAQWNERHTIGTPVTVRKDDGTFVDTVTKSEAQVLSGHSAVIWLEGVRGCYLLERVTPRQLEDFDNAKAYVVGRAVASANRGGMIENVVTVVGLAGEKLVARGYLSPEEASKLRDSLTDALETMSGL
jgi:hypothetical protein